MAHLVLVRRDGRRAGCRIVCASSDLRDAKRGDIGIIANEWELDRRLHLAALHDRQRRGTDGESGRVLESGAFLGREQKKKFLGQSG